MRRDAPFSADRQLSVAHTDEMIITSPKNLTAFVSFMTFDEKKFHFTASTVPN
jgi:hypothetical protein